MRRGIGVGYVHSNAATKTQMNELGSRITAERVGDISAQLESLEAQLRTLSQRHKEAIMKDPVVRARFRQLAESLGLDLLSSQKNVFAGVLGLGDFYFQLAGKVVEFCMNERKFCGSYVPLKRTVEQVELHFDGLISKEKGKKTHISEDDVTTALSKLRVLGEGYTIVKLGGVKFIQTTPDGTKGTDVALLVNYLIECQQRQVADRSSSLRPQKNTEDADVDTSSDYPGGKFGAAYILGTRRTAAVPDHLLLAAHAVSFSEADAAHGLHWDKHRTAAAVSRLVHEGALWVDDGGCSSADAKQTEMIHWFFPQ